MNNNTGPPNQSMREKYSHSIRDSAGKEQRGKTQKFLCVKIRNGKESLCMRMNNSGEDEITVRGCSANSWSPRKCLRETKTAQSLCVSDEQPKSWSLFPPNMSFNPLVECGCGHGLIVLPHSTPSHNCLNHQQSIFNESGWN